MPTLFQRASQWAGSLRYQLLMYTLIAWFFFIFNPQGLVYNLGNDDGRYSDRVDSYSEYIVRNTIKRNILRPEDKSFLPIITKGYASRDYTYSSEDYAKYFSTVIVQTIPETLVAKALRIRSEKKLETYFEVLRAINAFFFSCLLCFLGLLFSKKYQLRAAFLIPFLVGGTSGFVFFSENLYFISISMLLPAALVAWRLTARNRLSPLDLLGLVVLGCFYFLKGYEFSTIFALLTAFSAAIFTTGDWKRVLKNAAIAFSVICLSFALAIFLHIKLVAIDSHGAMSLGQASELAFASLKHRTSSTDGVPAPLTYAFVKAMGERWSLPALSFKKNGFQLSELEIILSLLAFLALRLGRMTFIEKIAIAYAFAGYLSWYVLAYQHIMWHPMYDWYIFSLTMGLSFNLLVLFYANKIIEAVMAFSAKKGW